MSYEIVICKVCHEEVEPSTCRHCGGEGGSRSNSEDDGYAWSDCDYCCDGRRYFCYGESSSGTEVDEHGAPIVVRGFVNSEVFGWVPIDPRKEHH